MQDVVGLAGLDPHYVMLRNSMREQIFEYIARKQSAADWRQRWLVLELARRLEEILFRKFSNKNDYYNMMKGPIEPQVQFAIKTPSAQNQQNQQMSRQIASSSGYGTMIPTPVRLSVPFACTTAKNTESKPDKAALSPTRALTNLPYKRSASPPAQFTSDPPTKKTRSSTKKTNE